MSGIKREDWDMGKGSQDYTILQLIDKVIGNYKAELAPGSLRNYNATRDYVGAFCKAKYNPAMFY